MVNSEKTVKTPPSADTTGSTERAWQMVTGFSNALVQTLLVLLALSISTVSKVALVLGILALTALTIFPGHLLKSTAWLRRAVPERLYGVLGVFSQWVRQDVWWLLSTGVLITVVAALAVVPKDEPWVTCQIPDEITLLASAETSPAIQRAAGEFMAGKVDWWGCRQMNINVSGLRAGEVRDRLADWTFPVQPATGRAAERPAGKPPGARPDGWIADSLQEIDYMDRGTNGVPAFGERTVVATSPLVIAAPEDLAEELTEASRNPGDRDWADLLRGRPGARQQVVRTHPLASNVGLMATAAAPGPSEGLSRKVRPGDTVRDVMCRYASSLDTSAMVMTEQQFYELTVALSGADPALPASGGCAVPGAGGGWPSPSATLRNAGERPSELAVVYPRGGHAMRYACVSKRWPDLRRPPAVERTVEEFCDFLREALPRYGFRDAEGRLNVERLPVKAHRLRSDAPVAANWKPDIPKLLYKLATPLADHVLVVVDVSGSMARNKVNDGRSRLEAAIQVAQLAVTSKRGERTTGIMTFFPDDDHAVPLAPVGDEGKALTGRLTDVQNAYRGGSRPDPPMRPIIAKALDQMERTGDPAERKAVLVLTDGGNPRGLTGEDIRGHGGVRLLMLSFDLHGCDTSPLPRLRDEGLLSCYDASTDPDQKLDDAFTELRTITE
ncbi:MULTISPECIES: vWA domain-containing protein [unclassified Streptosporangium]|uniref:vWA domain-containing protein n=1 Tax=unclassified Streptosporangium TaxID=2632669 RepID=UPI002E2B153A|nr:MULTISPECIES: VWA domain-containing protein [unclassified Streptosporangium]